jgi:hypothetical protein
LLRWRTLAFSPEAVVALVLKMGTERSINNLNSNLNLSTIILTR